MSWAKDKGGDSSQGRREGRGSTSGWGAHFSQGALKALKATSSIREAPNLKRTALRTAHLDRWHSVARWMRTRESATRKLDPGFANGGNAWGALGTKHRGLEVHKGASSPLRCHDGMTSLEIITTFSIQTLRSPRLEMLDLPPTCGLTGRASTPTAVEGCVDEGHSSGSARNSLAPLCGCSGATIPRTG